MATLRSEMEISLLNPSQKQTVWLIPLTFTQEHINIFSHMGKIETLSYV